MAQPTNDDAMQIHLFSEAEPCLIGYAVDPDQSFEQIVERVRAIVPDKKIRLVADWVWLDIAIPDRDAEKFAASGFQPCIVYAENVLHDTSAGLDSGNWVRTSPLQRFHDEQSTFETANTAYVLIGPGLRKRISTSVLKIIASLY